MSFASKLDSAYSDRFKAESLLRALVTGLMNSYQTAYFKGSYQKTVYLNGHTNVSFSIDNDNRLRIYIDAFSLRDYHGAILRQVSGCGDSGEVHQTFNHNQVDSAMTFIANALAHCNYYPTKQVEGLRF